MSELRKLSQLRLLCLLKFIILSWRQIHRGCQVVIYFAIHDLGVCGLLTGDKLQKVKSKVTKHPKRRPRDVIIHKYKSFMLSSLSSVCTLLLSSTDTHQYTHQYPISRWLQASCSKQCQDSNVPPSSAGLHSLSFIQSRAWAWLPSSHTIVSWRGPHCSKNTPLLTGWGPKSCGRPWRRTASLTRVKHAWLEGLNFGHGRDWLVWEPASMASHRLATPFRIYTFNS